MNAPTAPASEVGTRVTASPWLSGYELLACLGIVIGDQVGGEYTTVWFPSLGHLDRGDEDDRSVQAILNDKITVTGHIRDYAKSTLTALWRRVRQRDRYYRHTDLLINAIAAAAKDNGYLKDGKLT